MDALSLVRVLRVNEPSEADESEDISIVGVIIWMSGTGFAC